MVLHRRCALEGQETNLSTKRSIRAPVLGRQTEFTETVSACGRVAPKRRAGLPVSPVTRAETNMDVSVEESGPVSVEEFGPASFDEDVVQEAEELKHVPAPVLPSNAEVESHNVSRLPFRSWCSACVPWRDDFHWGHHEVDIKNKRRQNRYRLSPWDYGVLWGNRNTEHMTYFPSVHRARSQK